jgi:hypothetical protein
MNVIYKIAVKTAKIIRNIPNSTYLVKLFYTETF